LQLVIKEINATDNLGTPLPPIPKSPVEEPTMQDEAETLKRKAAERQSMLRNLSFNNNTANPNSEYDTVPAYVRRNLSLDKSPHQHVERFYSNMTVKTDESNTIHFSTINAFFEGNRPD
jgi:cell division protein FtsZ